MIDSITPPQVAMAREAWGDALPEWVEAMARECARTSQNRVAQKMARSAALVSQVLRRRYPGDMAAVEDVFNGVFRGDRVNCPALGLLPLNECRDWRVKSRKFVNVNALRVRMYRACAHCPLNQKEADDA